MTPDDTILVDFLSERTHEWSDIWYLFNFFVAGLVTVSLAPGITRKRFYWMSAALYTFAVAHFCTVIAYYRPFTYAEGAAVGETARDLIGTITPPPYWLVYVLYWFSVLLVQGFIYRRLLRETRRLP